jgi:hypothetical protein
MSEYSPAGTGLLIDHAALFIDHAALHDASRVQSCDNHSIHKLNGIRGSESACWRLNCRLRVFFFRPLFAGSSSLASQPPRQNDNEITLPYQECRLTLPGNAADQVCKLLRCTLCYTQLFSPRSTDVQNQMERLPREANYVCSSVRSETILRSIATYTVYPTLRNRRTIR